MASIPRFPVTSDLRSPTVSKLRGVKTVRSHTCDRKLLETTLAATVPREELTRVTSELLYRFNGFAGTIAACAVELRDVRGLSEAGVAALKTMHAAAIRVAHAEIIGKPLPDIWPRLVDYLLVVFSGKREEQTIVIYLDEDSRIQTDEVHSTGSVSSVPINARKIINQVLKLNASGVIIAHNHPSGDPSPSVDDIELTRLIELALTPISVKLWDHVIIGHGRWISLRYEQSL